MVTFESVLADLQDRHPSVYPLWHEQTFGSPSNLYADDPLNNCSVQGHAAAPQFAAFLLPYLPATGRVLDIGCGPYSKPLYLEGYPNAQISAIDPLAPFEGHPFDFQRSVAEHLPWPDATFDVVINASSLDHVLDLDRALGEIMRVLKPGGCWVVWEQNWPDQPRYDPTAVDFVPFDHCHLFKLGPWFVPMVLATGRLTLECQDDQCYVFRAIEDA